MSAVAAAICMALFAALAAVHEGLVRSAYRCAVVMAACWFVTALGYVA